MPGARCAQVCAGERRCARVRAGEGRCARVKAANKFASFPHPRQTPVLLQWFSPHFPLQQESYFPHVTLHIK